MRIRRKRVLTFTRLTAYKLDPDKDNLFDDLYGKERFNCEQINHEILKIQNDELVNFIKIGRMLLQGLRGDYIESKGSMEFLRYYGCGIKRTQAIKYIEAYNYCNRKFQNNQPTDKSLDLGIEKLYLITRLEEINNQERLEQFVSDKKLTVKQLSKLVEILNGNSEAFNHVKLFKEEYCSDNDS